MLSDDKSRRPLLFFGEVSASISHDIKNVFAIINEDAGLLEDLALMVEKGMPLDPKKIVRIASKIQNQIKRGDLIVKNMNMFAHSIDESVKKIDVGQTIKLVFELLKRKLAAKAVTAEFLDGDSVLINTDPFMFEMAMARIITNAMDSAGKDGHISVETVGDGNGASVLISGLIADSDYYDEDSLVDVIKDIQGKLKFDKTSGVLKISLPGSLSV